MPARGTRKSSSTATTNLPVPSPKTPRSSSKRRPEETPESSPATRRSKRVKPVEGDDSQLSPDRSEVDGNGVASQSIPSQNLEPSLVKTEGEEDVKTSVTVKHEKNGAKTEAKSETTAAVTGKTSKKRKTKEEKEAEAMPLRARTPGLRMLVGAHVSAAKGVFNAVNNSMHIGGNAFALFLKSQRKWDNPPLQDDHRDQFRQLCQDNGYDAAKYVVDRSALLQELGLTIADISYHTDHIL
ncbi:DNA-(apurinic or apyrimidinic site) lyase [Elasticomyces elasticus]|nr:DNA-(apurinic or apyrimidinic site) lyase [Elasticomyces elasticus]